MDEVSSTKRLDTREALEEALQASASGPVLLFKHSISCGVSSMARTRARKAAQTAGMVLYELVIQESRALSGEVADLLGIRHQSPQAIMLYNGKPVFHTSHFGITVDAIQQAVHSLLDKEV